MIAMAQALVPQHRYTYAEYLAYERDSALKHEYVDGEILAMPGGSRRHSATEQVDRGAKWKDYQLLPSLKEYVLVSQSEPRIEVYRRLATGSWEYSDATEGTVQLETGPLLDIRKLYEDLPI